MNTRRSVGSILALSGGSLATAALAMFLLRGGDSAAAPAALVLPEGAPVAALEAPVPASVRDLVVDEAAAVDGAATTDAAGEPVAGQPTREQRDAYGRVWAMALRIGTRLPRKVTGTADLWAAIDDIDAAYGRESARNEHLFVARINEIIAGIMDGDRSRLVPVDAVKRTRDGKPVYRSQEPDVSMRTVHIGADAHYELHIPRGEDARLDEIEDDLVRLSTAATDAMLAVLTLHNVPMHEPGGLARSR